MSRTRYVQVRDGEWVLPTPQAGHKMRCCDCGLVHSVDFRVLTRAGKRIVVFRATRDVRATAAVRRGKDALALLREAR